jgi:hypothetical protein
MRESTQAKSQRILDAMLQGQKITPAQANRIGDTTDGTRYIRFIREKYPVKSEKVEGELYHRYWIDEEYLAGMKKPFGERIKTFFDDLLNGGMFEEARV